MNIYKSEIKNKFGEFTIFFEAKTDVLLYGSFSENTLRWLNRFYPDSNLIESNQNPIITQFQEYFHAERKHFQLPYRLSGSDFQRNVWKFASEIEYGKTKTYQEIAEMLGKPLAARAVGNALGKNHLLLVIPCHRVVRKDGNIGGFSGGKKIKERLLYHENKNS